MIIRASNASVGHRLAIAIITTRGVIFCHVNIKNSSGQDSNIEIGGNQKWHGAAPNFVVIDNKIIVEKNQLGCSDISKAANSNVEEDIACTMKYLIAPSVV